MAERVAVLMGGLSAEREVSLISGAAVAKALRGEGYQVVEIDAGHNLWNQLKKAAPDVIFNALHGEWGEDGKMQGVLELYGKPYTHSGVLASALAMDKHLAKTVLRSAGITVPDGMLVKREKAAREHALKPPYVVKPNAQGSSVGVYVVQKGANRPPPGYGHEQENGRYGSGREICPGP